MKFTIVDKAKKSAFIAIFELIKTNSSLLNMNFKEDHIYMQGMDRSHVCLFDIIIRKEWLGHYEVEKQDTTRICINTNIVYSILASTSEDHSIHMYYDGNPEQLNIDLNVEEENKTKHIDKREFSHYFRVPLIDDDYNYLEIPETEYDADFSISSKKMVSIVNKMAMFGDTLKISCNEEKIDLFSTGVEGEMKVNIPIDDLFEFSINEGDDISLGYNLNFLQKMCLTTKITEHIDFGISKGAPMRIKYGLTEGTHVILYIAPKIEDDD
jgi:proliferating cell nuclear antigen PCNA